ncbi:polysaccharide deacetylase family protein [uncultured Sphingomonas sp.]|uniref:polysaccharide deacetylase family protein n=1 Tax=uncultured Sphingomonas sp. TaxID=158754 RepID=UPI0035C99EFD
MMARCVLALLTLLLVPVPAGAQKRIALTFDDVPRAPGAFLTPDERTRRLIAALGRARVRQAAFFVNPGAVADRTGGEQRIGDYVKAGHVLANHSWSHPHLNASSAADYLADIDRAESWLKGREGYRPWFRYPFLDEGGPDKPKRDAVRAGLAVRALRNGYVTVDASDWNMEQLAVEARAAGKRIDTAALRDLYIESHLEAAEFYDGLARRTLGRSPAHVMLLHETDIAALFVGDLVEALRRAGWEVVSADEAFADPIATARPDVPSAQGTLTEALAWEKGLPAPRWYARNDTRLANRLFAERVLHETPSVAEKPTPVLWSTPMTRSATLLLLLAPVLLLAACGGGSQGANTAADETSAAPVVQQGVPENLTDDPRNEAIPLDAPPTSTRPKAQ